MTDHIIYVKKDEQHLIGNINIRLSNLVEVKIVSPFEGFTLRTSTFEDEEWDEHEQKENAEKLLILCFRIARVINDKKKIIKTDFHQLLHNLNTFNNQISEDYVRNRDELMRVFLRTHFSDAFCSDLSHIDYGKQIFIFLNTYFALNGKCAELNISSFIQDLQEPPPFTELESLLREYLGNTEEQRIELLVQQIIKKQNTKYSWFLSQEFINHH